MNDATFLIVLVILAILALALGIWIGLGYPGRYEKYERTGKAPRIAPFRMLLNRLGGRSGRGGKRRGVGTGRWSRR
jgi:hypothetical protein